jgi:hypothetical protein
LIANGILQISLLDLLQPSRELRRGTTVEFANPPKRGETRLLHNIRSINAGFQTGLECMVSQGTQLASMARQE